MPEKFPPKKPPIVVNVDLPIPPSKMPIELLRMLVPHSCSSEDVQELTARIIQTKMIFLEEKINTAGEDAREDMKEWMQLLSFFRKDLNFTEYQLVLRDSIK